MSRRAFTLRLALLTTLAGLMLACAFGPEGAQQSPAGSNAVFSCATATPLPTVSPLPTVCTDSTPGPDGTPGPADCTKPEPTATPRPTATPYGRWLSPGDRGSSDTFYQDQDVYVGGLKVTLTGYRTAAISGQTATVAHIWTFTVRNEGNAPLDVQWPLQMLVREVQRPDGTSAAGDWWETPASEAAAGIAAWNPDHGTLAAGEQRTVTVAMQAPAGRAHAVGFFPDPVRGDRRDGLGTAAHLLWFLPAADPSCAGGNTSGPPRQGDGGAVYPKPLPPPASAPYGATGGWPVAANGAWVVSQGFGCSSFHELSGFDCPNEKPYYHTGIDIAAAYGTPLLSVVSGRVIFIGPSSGSRECTFPGAQPPRFNLGWETIIQILDSAGRATGVVNKIGHQIVNSQRVQVGDPVQIGQVIGLMGSTGCSTGTHVHEMFQTGDTFLNPFIYLGPPRR